MASTRSATDDESDDRPIDVVEAAVRFVASQCGGPARMLAIHHLRDRGLCAGCTVRPTRWPCSAAVIALSASTQSLTG
jgi:hypothetical protein